MGEVFSGALVFHIIPALWQGCTVGVAASILQTLHILLGNESESRCGLAQCLCCPVPVKAWNCSSLLILHLVIHTCLHISFFLGFGRSVISQFSWYLSSLLHHCCFWCPASTSVPHSCFSQAPLLQSSPFLSLSLWSLYTFQWGSAVQVQVVY